MKNFILPFLGLFLFSLANLNAQDEKFKLKTGSKVNVALFSPDGKYLAVGRDTEISIWHAGSETPSGTIKTQHYGINAMAFSSDGKFIVSGGKDNKVSIWNADSQKLEKNLGGNLGEVYSIDISPDGKYVAAGTKDKQLWVWDLKTGTPVKRFEEHRESVRAVSFSPDSRYLASSGDEKLILIRDLKQMKTCKIFNIHAKTVNSISFSPDGKKLASADDMGYVLLTDINSKESSSINFKKHDGPVLSVKFSGDNQYLVTGSEKGEVFIWNIKRGIMQYSVPTHGGKVQAVDFSSNGKYLVNASYSDGYTRVNDVSNLDIAPKMFFNHDTDKNPPQVLITSPKMRGDKLNSTEENTILKGLVVDESGVFAVAINGMKAQLSEGGNFEMTMKLAMGENVVKIEATDVANNTTVKKITIIRGEDNSVNALDGFQADPENYLLVVGIDNYKEWPMLSNAVSDIDAVQKVLQDKYNFKDSNVLRLANETATKQGILNAFKELVARVTPNDNVLVYFSGHGHYNADFMEGYWIPVDASKSAESDYLPNSFLLKMIKQVNSKHTFLVADACFSGSLFSEASRGGYEDNVSQYKSRWGLTSGRLEYVSDGQEGKHSPFCKYFIEFLEKNEKDKTSVSELVQYVKVKVANESTQTPIGNPLKNVGDEGGELVFELK